MARPPKMDLPYAQRGLTLVKTEEQHVSPPHRNPTLIRGYRYSKADCPQQPLDASADYVVQDYLVGLDSSQIVSTQPNTQEPILYWDSPEDTGLLENRCELTAGALTNLTIQHGLKCAYLSVTPHFEFSFTTAACTAQLGEIRLVSSNRWLLDTSGRSHTLLNTDANQPAVLYLQNDEDTAVVKSITPWQEVNTEKHYRFNLPVGQKLMAPYQAIELANITVLEHYTSYFMQRPLTDSPDVSRWVPAYAPITWGWSIRVEPDRQSQDWIITRRKLIMPVVGNDGYQLPQWQSNSLHHQHRVFTEV